MTVCIGAICDDGNTAIVASDRMVTGSYPPIEFEHTQSKIYSLTEYCVALTAGNALKPVEIIQKTIALARETKKPPDMETLANRMKGLYQALRAMEAEDVFLRPRTMTVELFYREGTRLLPPDVFAVIDSQFYRYDFGLELLVVGTDFRGAHIYTVRNPGLVDRFDSLGFHAIGVGALHAIQCFIARRYKISYNLEEAVNIVYAAKKVSEVAPGVGRETDIDLIFSDGIVPVDPEIIEELSRIYQKVRKPVTDEIRESSELLKTLLEKRKRESENEKREAEENHEIKGKKANAKSQ